MYSHWMYQNIQAASSEKVPSNMHKMRIQIILHMTSESSRPLLSIHTSVVSNTNGLIRQLVSIDDSQFGFVPGRGTTDANFQIETTLTIFDLQVIPMLPTKFQVNWPFGSGEEAKKRFSRWQHRRSKE